MLQPGSAQRRDVRTFRLTALLLGLAMGLLPVCGARGAWIDLGDEGAEMWMTARVDFTGDGQPRVIALTTGSETRVSLRVDDKGVGRLWLYGHSVSGPIAKPGEPFKLVVKIISHAKAPDMLLLATYPADEPLPAEEPTEWTLINDGGDSRANLSQVEISPAQSRGHITQVRVAGTWASLLRSPLLDDTLKVGPEAPDISPADPVNNPTGGLMLDLPATGKDMGAIDYDKLPVLKADHSIVSLGSSEWKFRLHNYLAWHDGRFWCIWSHGPQIEEFATQHVRYSTSKDGLNWTEPKVLVGPPKEGYGYIARGLWLREGELIALASMFKAPGYAGGGLSLHAFRWSGDDNRWDHMGMVRDDSMNNFAPKKLPDGNWMMTRRSGSRDVSVMIGGVKAFDQWDVLPLASYAAGSKSRPEEPYWYILPDGKNIVGLFRNNGGKDLLRAFSTDNGRTWSPLVHTNFPDARSKFNVVHTTRGYYVLISNANPMRRNPLCLSISKDGLVYTRMGVLPIPARIDKNDWSLNTNHGDSLYESFQYPHVIEHDGALYIAYSRRKQAIEVLRLSLDDVEAVLKP